MTTSKPTMRDVELTGINCLTLEIHLWSGKKRLRKEALIARNPAFAELPPKSLATLGSIKICDADDLAPFTKIKRRAEKLMATHGLPILGSYGFSDSNYDAVYAELAEMKLEFEDIVRKFELRFEKAIETWRNHPDNIGWSGLIKDIPTPEKVAGKLSFDFHPLRITAPTGDMASQAVAHHRQKMTGLKGELFEDGAAEAQMLIDKCLYSRDSFGAVKKRDKVTWKTLRPLKRIATKFQSFAFLDPTVEPLVEMIEHVLDLLPAEGPIDGVHLVHIWALAQTLADPVKAAEVASMAYERDDPAQAFETVVTTRKAPAISATQSAVFDSPVQVVLTTAAVQANASSIFNDADFGLITQEPKQELDLTVSLF